VPAVDEVQFSPFHYRRRLLDYCLEHGIVFEAYGPLARGRGVQHPTITALAERLDRTPAQVMLRWAIQHQAVVIPKSSRKDRISSNARLFDFELADPGGRLLVQRGACPVMGTCTSRGSPAASASSTASANSSTRPTLLAETPNEPASATKSTRG